MVSKTFDDHRVMRQAQKAVDRVPYESAIARYTTNASLIPHNPRHVAAVAHHQREPPVDFDEGSVVEGPRYDYPATFGHSSQNRPTDIQGGRRAQAQQRQRETRSSQLNTLRARSDFERATEAGRQIGRPQDPPERERQRRLARRATDAAERFVGGYFEHTAAGNFVAY